jgi:hypothetical protein
VDAIASALISSIIMQGDEGNTSLCNWPLQFGTLTSGNKKGSVCALYNSKFPTLAYQSTHFAWVVYGFNSGHFPSTISKQNLLFWIILVVIPMRPTAHSFRSLYHLVLQFYQAQHLSLITFVDQATNGRLTGI